MLSLICATAIQANGYTFHFVLLPQNNLTMFHHQATAQKRNPATGDMNLENLSCVQAAGCMLSQPSDAAVNHGHALCFGCKKLRPCCAPRDQNLFSLPRAVTNPWVACSFENQCRNIQVSQRSYWGQAGADERALSWLFHNWETKKLMGPLSSSTFVAFLAHRTAQHGLGGSARGHRNGV